VSSVLSDRHGNIDPGDVNFWMSYTLYLKEFI